MFNYPMSTNHNWQKIKVKKFSPQKFAALLSTKSLFVLDVRPLNFKNNTSFIKGSVLCPLVFLADHHEEIPRDRQIVIADWAMKQSPVAAKYLIAKGYSVLGVLKGGIERWESEKFPVEKRKPEIKCIPLSPFKEESATEKFFN